MLRSLAIAFALVATFQTLAVGTVYADEWKQPADGLLTDKQVVNYIAAQKEITQLLKAVGKAAEGSKSGFGAYTLVAGLEDKYNAILAKHDLKRAEYDWANGKLLECWAATLQLNLIDQSMSDLVEQKKKNATDLQAAQQKVSQYEIAAKAGTRVMTKEQRQGAVQSAKDAQAAATDEAKQHAEEAKTAAEEAAKIEAEAKAAEALAKNPPADVEKDSRDDFIKAKREEAMNLLANAKESRDREKEARKAEAESKAKAAAASKAMANPEIPVTDEEKAQVKAENTEGLAAAKSEVDLLKQAGQLLAEADGQTRKQQDEVQKDLKPQNVALARKHLKELQDAWGMEEKK
jgi:hypothetical protein